MFAVIFRAKINVLDDAYPETANRMRELAKAKYGCIDFVSVSEGNLEIAISYWETLAQIKNWKQDPEHLLAQQLGKDKWYESYQVQIVEVLREY